MWLQLVSSCLASIGFGILFNTPKRLLPACGITGMIGWGIYLMFEHIYTNNIAATLVAAFSISALSQMFARYYKTPVIVFSAAGIIPLVPGGLAYHAMLNFVHNNDNVALAYAAKVFLISGSIAVGLLFSEVAYRVLLRRP